MGRGAAYCASAIAFMMLIVLAGCAGLAGEPRIVATLPPATALPREVGYPLSPPDVARGAAIFAERCTACHGVNGDGRGALVASGEIPAAANFRDPATARDQTPREWFETITNGRIEKMMPPWREALTEEERWAVALYTYTLATTAEDITSGRAVYSAECAECHGETGVGDGERAAELSRPVGDFTDLTKMVATANQALYTIVSEGQGPQMPAFADELSEAQMRAAVAYVRTLALVNADVIGQQPQPPAATEEAGAPESAPESALGIVSGMVTNGTAGSSVPDDLVVTLRMFDAQGIQTTRETNLQAGGLFIFPDVTFRADTSYMVTAAYRDRIFASQYARGDPSKPELDLPLILYELTEDPAVVTINRMVMQIQAVGDGLQVTQAFLFSNTSDRVYTTGQQVGSDRFASVVVPLPPGSVVVGFSPEEEQRYVVDQAQPAIIDTAPVIPDEEHIVAIAYFIPYEGGAIIDQPVNYALDGQVRLLLRPDTIKATSNQLAPLGEETVADTVYQAYGGQLTLDPGGAIRFELGGATAPTSPDVSRVTPNNLPILVIIIIAAEVALIGGLLYAYLRRRRKTAPVIGKRQLMDALVRQIAELDTDYEAGKIDEATYQRQREQLKARLAQLMGDK